MWTRPTPAGSLEHFLKPKKAVINCKKDGACHARVMRSADAPLLCREGTGHRRVRWMPKTPVLRTSKPDIAEMIPQQFRRTGGTIAARQRTRLTFDDGGSWTGLRLGRTWEAAEEVISAGVPVLRRPPRTAGKS